MLLGLPVAAAARATSAEPATSPDADSTVAPEPPTAPTAEPDPEPPAPPEPEPEPASKAVEPSLQDVCKIDPSACPTLEPEVQLSGPLEGAPAISQAAHGDIGSKVSERFVSPSGHVDVRGELGLITSDAVVTPTRLKLGDLALFRPSVRRSFSDKLELSLTTTLLAKEPTTNHDWTWQGASLGATFEPTPGYALVLQGQGGPLLDGAGSAWSGAAGAGAKWSLGRNTRLGLSLGNQLTALDERGRLGTRAWIDELVLGTEAQYGRSEAAMWVGLNYAIPLAKAGNLPNAPTPIALQPSTRLDLQVGFVFRAGKEEDWDLFAYYAWLDRGEASRPETRLPILDGGFDQQQVVLGIGHRFAPKPPADEHGF